MSLGVVLASAPSPRAKPSPSSGQALSPTDTKILLGIVALVLVSLAVIAWIASRDWRRRLRYRRGNPPRRRFRRGSPPVPGMSVATRSAFARGDYMAVIELARPGVNAQIKLLLAQSYARIGADVLAANTASDAITAILAGGPDWSAANAVKGFSVPETQALRRWLDRLDGIEGLDGINQERLAGLRESVLGLAPERLEESVQLGSELDEMRQRVAAERRAEQNAISRNRWINLVAGTLAGGLAATSGVFGVTKGPTAVIALLAFASAAITATLTALKPAEREKESKVRADALGQLAAAIDFFDIDRPEDAPGLLPAVKAVHERLAVAEGRGTIVPLVASSKSTVRAAITSISPPQGPTSGGQDLVITGRGFKGATEVSFGATPASSYDAVSDTQITATTPPAQAPGVVNIRVTGPGGKSPINAHSRYKYLDDPAVTAITPATGSVAGKS